MDTKFYEFLISSFDDEFYVITDVFNNVIYCSKPIDLKRFHLDSNGIHSIDAVTKKVYTVKTKKFVCSKSNELLHEGINYVLKKYSLTTELVKINKYEEKTGLLKFSDFKEMYEQSIKNNSNSILVVLDIDYFKQINDQYGHSFGDKILHAISNVLKESFRKTDLKGRYGGDELLLCLYDVSEKRASELLKKVEEKINNLEIDGKKVTVLVDSVKHPLSVSIGFAKSKFITFDDNFDQADKALYYSKLHGKNRITDYSEMLESIIKKNSYDSMQTQLLFKIDITYDHNLDELAKLKLYQNFKSVMEIVFPNVPFFYESVYACITVLHDYGMYDLGNICKILEEKATEISGSITIDITYSNYDITKNYEYNKNSLNNERKLYKQLLHKRVK